MKMYSPDVRDFNDHKMGQIECATKLQPFDPSKESSFPVSVSNVPV